MNSISPLFKDIDTLQLVSNHLSDIDLSKLMQTNVWAAKYLLACANRHFPELKNILGRIVNILKNTCPEKSLILTKIFLNVQEQPSIRLTDNLYYKIFQKFCEFDFSFKERFLIKSNLDTLNDSLVKNDIMEKFLPSVDLSGLSQSISIIKDNVLTPPSETGKRLINKFDILTQNLNSLPANNSLECFDLLDECRSIVKEYELKNSFLFIEHMLMEDYSPILTYITRPYYVNLDYDFFIKRKKYGYVQRKIINEKISTTRDAILILNAMKPNFNLNDLIFFVAKLSNSWGRSFYLVEKLFKEWFSTLNKIEIETVLKKCFSSTPNECEVLISKLSIYHQINIIMQSLAYKVYGDEVHSIIAQRILHFLQAYLNKEIDDDMLISESVLSLNLKLFIIALIKANFPAQALNLLNQCSEHVKVFRDTNELIIALASINSMADALHFFNLSPHKSDLLKSDEGKKCMESLVRYLCNLGQTEEASSLVDKYICGHSDLRSRTAGAFAIAYAKMGNRNESLKALSFASPSSQPTIKAFLEKNYVELFTG